VRNRNGLRHECCRISVDLAFDMDRHIALERERSKPKYALAKDNRGFRVDGQSLAGLKRETRVLAAAHAWIGNGGKDPGNSDVGDNVGQVGE